LVIPHVAHDSNQKRWQKIFPNARIVCPQQFVDKLQGKFTGVLAAEPILEAEYGITTHSPPEGLLTTGDAVHSTMLNADEKHGGRCVLFHDLQVHIGNYPVPKVGKVLTALYTLGGWGPSQRTARFYKFVGMKKTAQAAVKKFLIETVANIPNIEGVVFSHGGYQHSTKTGKLAENIANAAREHL
jgi:hypothetical protein